MIEIRGGTQICSGIFCIFNFVFVFGGRTKPRSANKPLNLPRNTSNSARIDEIRYLWGILIDFSLDLHFTRYFPLSFCIFFSFFPISAAASLFVHLSPNAPKSEYGHFM